MIVGRPHVPGARELQPARHPHRDGARAARFEHRAGHRPTDDRLVADMLVADRRDRLQTMRMVRERLAPILGSAVRLGSITDGSGSFAAGRAASSVGFSSARIRAAVPPVMDLKDDDADSEEVHFFDRESASPRGAAPARDLAADFPAVLPAEVPDSRDGEAVILFDRASLNLPASID